MGHGGSGARWHHVVVFVATLAMAVPQCLRFRKSVALTSSILAPRDS